MDLKQFLTHNNLDPDITLRNKYFLTLSKGRTIKKTLLDEMLFYFT